MMKNGMTAVATLFIVASTLLTMATSEILYGETANMSFEVWAADLKPGFVLKEKYISDRLCYCKKPQFSSSYSSSYFPSLSFSLNIPPGISSSTQQESSFEYVFLTPPQTG